MGRIVDISVKATRRALHWLLAVVAGVAAAVAPSGAAWAHEVGGVGATNFTTTLSALTPAVPGVRLAVVENGSRLELRNTTAQEVVVRGYSDEPYARIGPDGVWLNDSSPATYLNADRFASTTVPADADPAAPPRWRKVSGDNVHRWHDHRIHWMLSTLPTAVAAAPTAAHRVSDWHVDLDYGGAVLSATGSLDWVPGPSPTPWYLLAAVAALLVVGAVFTRRAHTLVAAALVALIAADVLHAAGIALVTAGNVPERLTAFLGDGLTGLLIWPFGLVAAVLIAKRATFLGFVAMGVGGLLSSMMALDDAPVWWRSSAPSALPADLNRAGVALVVGLGAGLLVGGPLLWRRFKPQAREAAVAEPSLADDMRTAHPPGGEPTAGGTPATDPQAGNAPRVDPTSSPENGSPTEQPTSPDAAPVVLGARAARAAADVSADSGEAGQGGAVGRRGFAGTLAAGGIGAILGAAGGIAAGTPGEPGTPAGAPPAEPLTGVGATRIAFHGERQAGITTPARPQARLRIIAFDLAEGVDRVGLQSLLRRWTQAAAQLSQGLPLGDSGDDVVTGAGPSSLTVTAGFGPSLFGKAGLPATARPAELTPLPAFPGERLDPAHSDGDLCLLVHADDALVVFRAARALTRLAAPQARMRWQLDGFNNSPGVTPTAATGRNLMGQLDGTNNPQPTDEDFSTKVYVTDPAAPAWLRGGSVLVVRRIRMLLDDWDAQPRQAQERVIGRRKDTGAPLSGGQERTPANFGTKGADGALTIPADAHIRLATPAFNNGAAMLRRGYSYTDGDAAGLIFLAWQADPRRGFVPVQQRLVASDALNRFTRHETSALFAMPHGVAPGGHLGQDLFGEDPA
ncbi:Dyp-type peroxidase [Catellatospora methionotrophica]|uniref:Dyp-type peroxidase n=1 Tax=Catellatospora methionotrophica TaxID=121620 RepID=UPI0019421A2C|nr:Dyp-type peroxidase [Catellatospora methionotrophica]